MFVILGLFICAVALPRNCNAEVLQYVFELFRALERIEDMAYRRVLSVQLSGVRDAFHNFMLWEHELDLLHMFNGTITS